VTRTRSPSIDAAVVAVFLLLGGAGSVWLGQDNSGDLRFYHFYNGYALLTGRLSRDIAPANLGTFFNPVMDVLHYWGMVHLSSRLFAFLLGGLHGACYGLVYLIARAVFATPARGPALAAAALAAVGPTAVMVLGTSSGDHLSLLPGLGALLLIVSAVDEEGRAPRRGPVMLAGVLAGAAVGFKLTAAPFTVALGVALVAGGLGLENLAVFVGTAAVGYLAVAGYWCWQLFWHLGNPLFPFANQIFHSPFIDDIWVRDETFRPHGLVAYLRPPLDLLLGHHERLQEYYVRDARFFVVLLAGVGYVGWLAAARVGLAARPVTLHVRERMVLAYLVAGYALWLFVFYYYRYAFPLELLSPIALYVLLRRLPWGRPPVLFLAAAVALTLWARFEPRAWGRSWTWHEGGFDVHVPPLGTIPNAIVLEDIPGNAFIIPFFPGGTRFFNFHHQGSAAFDALIAREVARHDGPVLFTPPIGDRRLASLGLRDTGHCEPIKTDHGKFALCLAERSTSLRGAP
jgi:hypothetical protein